MMKKPLATTIVFGVALLGASTFAHADELGRVTIPFSFTVNGHTLPGGQYDVRTDDQATSVVMLDNVSNPKTGVMFSTIPDYRRGPEHEKVMLSFVQHGSEHQLSTVWQPGQPGRDVVNR
jgi:hypothetical protein